jgi:hypothetical protein
MWRPIARPPFRRVVAPDEQRFAHPDPNENAVHLEKRPGKDASHLRSQAELCLQMARAMSDDKATENLANGDGRCWPMADYSLADRSRSGY